MKLFKSSTLASPKLRQRKRRAFKIRIAILILALLALVCGLSSLSKLDALTIHTIVGKGNALITTDDIAAIANKDLEGNILLLFSRRNFLLYPKAKIRDDIAAAYPILSMVDVKLKGLTALEVSLSERTPKALWCAYDASLGNSFTDSCYLMDATGFVYIQAPEFKGSPYIKYYGRLGQDPIGKTYEPEHLSKLMDFIEGVRSLDVTPALLYAEDNGDYELHLLNGGKILFNDESDLDATLINLSTVLQDNIAVPSKREAGIDYIDLRYGNRVFFKLKGGVQEETAGSAVSR